MGKRSCWHQKFAGGTPIWTSGDPERALCAASAFWHPQSASNPKVLKSQQETFLSAMPKTMKETPLGFNPSQQSPWKGLLAQGPSRRHSQLHPGDTDRALYLPLVFLNHILWAAQLVQGNGGWYSSPQLWKPETALGSIPACPSHSLWAVLLVQGPGEWHLCLYHRQFDRSVYSVPATLAMIRDLEGDTTICVSRVKYVDLNLACRTRNSPGSQIQLLSPTGLVQPCPHRDLSSDEAAAFSRTWDSPHCYKPGIRSTNQGPSSGYLSQCHPSRDQAGSTSKGVLRISMQTMNPTADSTKIHCVFYFF